MAKTTSQDTSKQLTKLSRDLARSVARIEKATDHIDDFKKRGHRTYDLLDTQAQKSIDKIKRLLRWMRWDRYAIAIISGLLAALITASYVNAEVPWQSHARATKERLIGKTILTVWPSLSAGQRHEINRILGTKLE